MSNEQLDIGNFDATIEFEPELIIGRAPGSAGAAGEGDAASAATDALRLRELLRPVIIELLEDELARYTRMRG
jgi:hypothetical protein